MVFATGVFHFYIPGWLLAILWVIGVGEMGVQKNDKLERLTCWALGLFVALLLEHLTGGGEGSMFECVT